MFGWAHCRGFDGFRVVLSEVEPSSLFYGIRAANQGILLPVSLLGLSMSRALSISSINSCRLIRALRRCFLRTCAPVWPSCGAQPIRQKTKAHRTTPKTIETKAFFIIFSSFSIEPRICPSSSCQRHLCLRNHRCRQAWGRRTDSTDLPGVQNTLYQMPARLSSAGACDDTFWERHRQAGKGRYQEIRPHLILQRHLTVRICFIVLKYEAQCVVTG